MTPDIKTMLRQANGGRVVRSHFTDNSSIDRRNLANAAGLEYALHGGFADAERVILTIYPNHIPNIDDPVQLLRLVAEWPADFDEDDILVALNLPEEERGDLREDDTGHVIATTKAGAKHLAQTTPRGKHGPIPMTLESVAASQFVRHQKNRTVVVPSLRIDVVGAKGFGVSRNYFQAGVDNKKVRLNGQLVTASSSIQAGDVLIAEGVGRLELKKILNETRRGNLKLEVEVTRT